MHDAALPWRRQVLVTQGACHAKRILARGDAVLERPVLPVRPWKDRGRQGQVRTYVREGWLSCWRIALALMVQRRTATDGGAEHCLGG